MARVLVQHPRPQAARTCSWKTVDGRPLSNRVVVGKSRCGLANGSPVGEFKMLRQTERHQLPTYLPQPGGRSSANRKTTSSGGHALDGSEREGPLESTAPIQPIMSVRLERHDGMHPHGEAGSSMKAVAIAGRWSLSSGFADERRERNKSTVFDGTELPRRRPTFRRHETNRAPAAIVTPFFPLASSGSPRLPCSRGHGGSIMETMLQGLVIIGGLTFSLAASLLIEELIFGQIVRVAFARRPDISKQSQKN